MMKIKLILVLTFTFSLLFSNCRRKNCEQLSNNFGTFNEAINKIKSTRFRIEEEVNTSRSSWVKWASFYSCDGNYGYFILKTDKEEYLYSGMPYIIWQQFKDASSFGVFYNEKIKHQYILQLAK